ncbi:MAG: glycosyltransferase [Clostridia bacterium]|nr:glycosyltransferase [Clostridia bacterium]
MEFKKEEDIISKWDYSKPLVSIQCIAFNHENYISQCLDGMLSQETTFPFEIIVHDDASTDNTATIIRQYALRYPKIIRPIYEVSNQYSKGDGSLSKILSENIKGTYIACCEADDYWCDDQKLQKQFDFLESNKDYYAVGHMTKTIDSSGNEIHAFIDSSPGDYTIKDNNKWQLFAHFSSYFYRNTSEFISRLNSEEYIKTKCPGDRKDPILFFHFGKLYVLPFVGSIYRYQSNAYSFTCQKSNFNYYKFWLEVDTLRNYAKSIGINVQYYERERELISNSIISFIRGKDKESYTSIKKHRHSVFAIDFLKAIPTIVKTITRKIISFFYK